MESLPSELIFTLCHYLDHDNLINVRRVNTLFHNIVKYYRLILKKIRFPCDQQLIKTLSKRIDLLTEIIEYGIEMDDQTIYTLQDLFIKSQSEEGIEICRKLGADLGYSKTLDIFRNGGNVEIAGIEKNIITESDTYLSYERILNGTNTINDLVHMPIKIIIENKLVDDYISLINTEHVHFIDLDGLLNHGYAIQLIDQNLNNIQNVLPCLIKRNRVDEIKYFIEKMDEQLTTFTSKISIPSTSSEIFDLLINKISINWTDTFRHLIGNNFIDFATSLAEKYQNTRSNLIFILATWGSFKYGDKYESYYEKSRTAVDLAERWSFNPSIFFTSNYRLHFNCSYFLEWMIREKYIEPSTFVLGDGLRMPFTMDMPLEDLKRLLLLGVQYQPSISYLVNGWLCGRGQYDAVNRLEYLQYYKDKINEMLIGTTISYTDHDFETFKWLAENFRSYLDMNSIIENELSKLDFDFVIAAIRHDLCATVIFPDTIHHTGHFNDILLVKRKIREFLSILKEYHFHIPSKMIPKCCANYPLLSSWYENEVAKY